MAKHAKQLGHATPKLSSPASAKTPSEIFFFFSLSIYESEIFVNFSICVCTILARVVFGLELEQICVPN